MTSAKTAAPHWPALGIAALIALWFVWGTSWPAMRTAFKELPIWQFRAALCTLGGLALLGLARAMRQRVALPWREVPSLGFVSLLNITGWHVFSGYGLKFMGAGHAAIVCYTMPVWTAIFSVFLLKERMDWRRIVALLLGMCGVGVLMSVDFARIGEHPIGALFMLGAATTWGLGLVLMKRWTWSPSMVACAGWQLMLGVIPIFVIAVLTEDFVLDQASLRAVLASVYLLLVGVVLGYILWFKVVATLPATVSSIGSLMTPVIGVASSAFLLGEEVTWREYVALFFVLSAVALVLLVRPRAPAPMPAAE